MRIGILILICLTGYAAQAQREPLPLQGELSVHDPSTIIKCEDQYWVFATGLGIKSLHSRDLTNWEAGPHVFTTPPAWTTNAVPGNRGYFWAPDIIHSHDQYLLYYSVSTWGSQTSTIGLATSPTLDPKASGFAWNDRGPVIRSSPQDSYNAIDPSVCLDSGGKLWLAFGSYWSGIKLVELDPQTGLRLPGNSAVVSLAWHESIEAACLCEHGGYYYLWVNWGQCCRGVKSTYNLRVGRSKTPSGPFLDPEGVDLMRGGGGLFLATEGDRIGPGHAGWLKQGERDWLSYHYYDGRKNGASTLAIRPLQWGATGWPELATP